VARFGFVNFYSPEAEPALELYQMILESFGGLIGVRVRGDYSNVISECGNKSVVRVRYIRGEDVIKSWS
jgi:hypothetical protein